MKTQGEETTDRYIRTFIRGLGKNRLGQHFMKVVTKSQERHYVSSQCVTARGRKTEVQREASTRKKRTKTEMNLDRDHLSFKIKQSALGDSVGVAEFALHRQNTPRPEGRIRARALTKERSPNAFNAFMYSRKENTIADSMRKRGDWQKLNNIDKILTTLVPNQIISTLRIYKERLRKFYNYRYRKQKLTSFFDYEYIQDYDSQLNYLQTLLTLKLQQIYYLCFLMLDQNSDGLICNNDLFSLATASTKQNPLINKDIYTIYQYVSQEFKKSGKTIVDLTSNQQYFKEGNMNLQKHRIIQYKQQKQKDKVNKKLAQDSAKYGFSLVKSMKIQPQTTKNIVTRKTHKHLFSFMKDQEEGQEAIKQLRKRLADNKMESHSNYKFKINFSRFKNIFAHSLPQTYFDVLYAQGGIKVPGKNYLPLHYDIDEYKKQEVVEQIIDRYGMFQDRLSDMRKTNRRSKLQRLSTGFLSCGY